MNKLALNKKILAIDFGDNNVGLAVSDDAGMIAFGKGVIKDYNSLKNLSVKIKDIIEEDKISRIVFGLPLGLEENSTAQVERLRRIGKKLAEAVNVPIFFIDESFSSFEARQKFGSKYSEHELAAMSFLQKYLDDLK
ncbi:Holliday junction resolvase RuvX [Candidatus Peregrinibacteria bacterium]|nr:Holliday junction resolvase RuvX [Candidatus Peregrinibacteria bacterium]